MPRYVVADKHNVYDNNHNQEEIHLRSKVHNIYQSACLFLYLTQFSRSNYCIIIFEGGIK